MLVVLVSFTLQFAIKTAAHAQTFTVVNTNTSGAGSFTQAVLDANASPGLDTIDFAIPGAGSHSFRMLDGQGAQITDPVNIDGTTQSGSACGETLNITIDQDNTVNSTLNFLPGSEGSTLKGVNYLGYTNSGIGVYAENITIKCNYINVSNDGMALDIPTAAINYDGGEGVFSFTGDNITIGGPNPEDGNVSANTFYAGNGYEIDDITISNNIVGMSKDGETYFGNQRGFSFSYGSSVTYNNLQITNNVFSRLSLAFNYTTGLNVSNNKYCVNKSVSENVCGSANSTFDIGDATNATIVANYFAAGGVSNVITSRGTDNPENVTISNNYFNTNLSHTSSLGSDNPNAIAVYLTLDGASNHLNSNVVLGITGFSVNGDTIEINGNVFGAHEGEGNSIYNFAVQTREVKVAQITNNFINDVRSLDPNFNYSVKAIELNWGGQTSDAYVISGNQIFGTTGTGISKFSNGSLLIQDNVIENIGYQGIYINQGTSVNIEDNAINGAGEADSNNGQAIYSDIPSTISNNVIQGTHSVGIVTTNTSTIDGNEVKGGDAGGIETTNSNSTITNNIVNGNSGTGIRVTGNSDYETLVEENTVYSNGVGSLGGLYLESKSLVNNNEIYENVGNGVYALAPSTFTNNTIYSNGGVGIEAYDQAGHVIHDNIVRNNSSSGIHVSKSSVVYKNVVYSNTGLGVDVDTFGANTNDDPDSDGVLNKPAARKITVNGANSDVTFDATLQAGYYRFDICNNPTTNGQNSCEVWLASTDKNINSMSTLREIISIPGTGYTLSNLTMQVTKYDGEALKESSEIGASMPMSADLSLQTGYIGTFDNNSAVFPGSELSVIGSRGLYMRVCNNGSEIVSSFHIDKNISGANINSFQVYEGQSSATALGTIDSNGNWSGTLATSQCLQIYAMGTVTGVNGSTVSFDPEITSSTLIGGSANDDSDPSNDSATPLIINVVDSPDVKMNSRLLTQGDITANSDVVYELNIQNIGTGTSNLGFVMLAFILPDGAEFNGIVDLDTTDNISLIASEDFGTNENGCTTPANAADVSPGLSAYNGQLVQCALGIPDGVEPGFSKFFELHITAGEGFVSGSTRAIAVVIAMDEEESQQFIGLFGTGQDGFVLGLNNIAWLTYDSDPLTVTINRCNGVAEVVEVDDACFTITFNKEIYAPSFTIDDLVLEGGGTVYSFVQDSDTQWTVRITGMTKGATLRLLLGAASVVDYSAITNGVQVLGENVVRFGTVASGESQTNSESGSATGANSAKGALATTGSNYDWYSPVMVILFGWALLLVANFRKKHSV